MTLYELGQNLNVSSEVLVSYFLHIGQIVPNNPNYELPGELILLAKENKELFDSKNISKTKVDVDEEIKDLDKIEFNKLLKKSNYDLIHQIKITNNLESMVLSGRLRMGLKGGASYGFFEDIFGINGETVYYPNYKDKSNLLKIHEVFVHNAQGLIENDRYYFDIELSKIEKRIKRDNPFLIETSFKKVQNANGLNEIDIAYKDKKTEIKNADKKLGEIIKLIKEGEDSATVKIAEYTQKIELKNNEISAKANELELLKINLSETNTNLSRMENLISTLKERIILCKNLQFIKEDDEVKYLNLLTAKEYTPSNHLNFETDFDKNFTTLSNHIHAYLYHTKSLIYTSFQIRNFLTLLQTHDIIVLSGLSGSGKTQIIKAFAEALGGICKIIPVKPNWTSSDDLIGYYNPLQMTFLPTPFTEAIVEAIQNPNQLYFICLDEMNLARVEYYFADFLSKLEERVNLPEIELYANHEEELFISEFSTLLNLVESSIVGVEIKSWQDFLNNDVARKKFFEMLGSTQKESMLQLHAKMKRRLIDILKFPSTIKIPENIRFIGAINVDETTHYFSPKILDRIHIVKFENPLLFEDEVNEWFLNVEIVKELKPVYIHPGLLSKRKVFPAVNNIELSGYTQILKEINLKFLLPLNIDFGVRSIRQSLNYASLNQLSFIDWSDNYLGSINSIILQKILPRFIFDGSEIAKDGKTKMEVVEDFQKFLSEKFDDQYFGSSYEFELGKKCSIILQELVEQAKRNNNQFNFFA